ncbi:MAG: acetyl-CoA carboxylase biotin carboxyl carrier protein [Thermoguttaceae bacterium]|nr:acetyl-CoA carboxylase biotin carboxyl carrier protein [Thermoguttaceae bacterium]MDW8036738.1 acetyl-CoA carboxylase biotin carboxyl carrier protein [Thermoguttaceae bacterium]
MSGSEVPEDVFDLRRIHRLLRLMEKHEVQEIELRRGEVRIRIRRGGGAAVELPAGAVPPMLPSPAAGAPVPAPVGPTEAKVSEHEYIYIKSPMVGTFYAAPSPDADPYVQPGDVVGPDTIVCIIEAMKVFNEIPAEVSGRIVAALVENGAPVEYGQPLFKLEPIA